MKILITGASGLIGRAVCARLSRDGHHLVTTSRRPARDGRGDVHEWNPQAGPIPAAAIEGVDAVIHLAGEPVAGGRWTAEMKRRIRDSRVAGTRNLVAGIAAAGARPRALISASAVGYYGDRGEEELDESSPPGEGFLSEVCVEWEREALAARSSSLRVALVRIGPVLARDGGALEKMLPAFRLGLGARLGDGRHWFPWIHIDDVTGIICHALENERIEGPINAVAPGLVRNAEFTAALARELHRPAFLSAPGFALNLLMGEMASVVLMSQRVVPRRASETQYRFKFPELEAALSDLL